MTWFDWSTRSDACLETPEPLSLLFTLVPCMELSLQWSLTQFGEWPSLSQSRPTLELCGVGWWFHLGVPSGLEVELCSGSSFCCSGFGNWAESFGRWDAKKWALTWATIIGLKKMNSTSECPIGQGFRSSRLFLKILLRFEQGFALN